MFSRNQVKLFYCHTCKKSSMIDMNNLNCPHCNSDFLEEGNMRESGLGLFSSLPEPNLSADSDENPQEPSEYLESFESVENAEPVQRADNLMAAFFRLIRSDLNHPHIPRFDLRASEGNQRSDLEFRDMNFERYLELIRSERRHDPISPEALESIETINISQEMELGECTICGDNFKLSEEAKLLECSHCFHSACLIPWLRIKSSCPTCRTTID